MRLLLLLIFMSCLMATQSVATILTFDVVPVPGILYEQYGDNVVAASMYWGNYEQGNGWTPDVVVSYGSRMIATDSLACGCVATWGGGYGDLGNIAYSVTNAGAFAEYVFDAPEGVQIRINGFDVAGFNVDQGAQPIEVRDRNGALLFSQAVTAYCCVPLSDPCVRTHTHVAVGVIAPGPLTLRVGNTWNVGVDNIDFDQTGTAAVRATSWGAIKNLYAR